VVRTLSLVIVALALMLLYLVQPIGCVEQGATRGLVDAGRLRGHVEVLSSSMAPRTASHPENLDRAADWIRDRFVEGGAETSFEEFRVDGRSSRNVIGRVGPDTKERIVVGAHYDAFGPGVGADDNASGVAGLIELVPLLRSQALPLRVELVAWSLEEPPHFRTRSMGSYVHAKGLATAGVEVRAMIGLEMIGFFSDAPGSQDYPVAGLGLVYPSEGNFITVVGCVGQSALTRRVKRAMTESSSLPVWSINAPRFVPGIDFSDHLNYWDLGFEAVMVSDTAFYRNAHYHEPTDTAATLDYVRMAAVVEGVFGAIKELCEESDSD
jgi:Zn-dependent M28 family amino/carboxypeptidase